MVQDIYLWVLEESDIDIHVLYRPVIYSLFAVRQLETLFDCLTVIYSHVIELRSVRISEAKFFRAKIYVSYGDHD